MNAAALANPNETQRWGVKRWTRKEVYALSEAGHLGARPICLINGRIIVMPVPGPIHDFTLDTLIEYLSALVPAGHYVRSQRGLGVGKRTDPGPDYAIVPGDFRDYLKDTPNRAIFVAEVAVHSRKLDLNIKPAIYAQAGVPEYWVIDVKKRRLIVHRNPIDDEDAPQGRRYASVVTLSESEPVSPLFAAERTIAIASLLPPLSS